MGVVTALQAYGHPPTLVSSFKFLVRVLTALDDDWLAVVTNLMKAQRKWDRMSRILGREGADTRTSRTFYKVVVQAVLLFDSVT